MSKSRAKFRQKCPNRAYHGDGRVGSHPERTSTFPRNRKCRRRKSMVSEFTEKDAGDDYIVCVPVNRY
ncbi:MAG: hypothetical protein RSC82_05050 [Oscillospiraceae bacterium]